jgi:hypothetical protein
VAASVPHSREGVVLREDGDPRPFLFTPVEGAERGRYPQELALDLEAVRLELLGQQLVRLVLLASKLGVLVEVSGDLDEPLPLPLNRPLRGFLQILDVCQVPSRLNRRGDGISFFPIRGASLPSYWLT